MTASKPAPLLKTMGDRIRHAVIVLEGTSLGKVERALGWSDGDLSKYASGKRGKSTVDVDKISALADFLHVEFEWLVRGIDPVRRGGRDTTPAEEAMFFARRSGTPEEAWQSAWERYKDREKTMTALDWAAVIHSEALLLEREAAHRVDRMELPVLPPRVDRPPMPHRRGPKP